MTTFQTTEWFVLERDVATLAFKCWIHLLDRVDEGGRLGCNLEAVYFYESQRYFLKEHFYHTTDNSLDDKEAIYKCLRRVIVFAERLELSFVLNEHRPILMSTSVEDGIMSDRFKLLKYEQYRERLSDSLGSAYLDWIDRTPFKPEPVTQKSRIFQWFEKVDDAPSGE